MVLFKLIPSKQEGSFIVFFTWAILFLNFMTWSWSQVRLHIFHGEAKGKKGLENRKERKFRTKQGNYTAWGRLWTEMILARLCQGRTGKELVPGEWHWRAEQHRLVVPNLLTKILMRKILAQLCPRQRLVALNFWVDIVDAFGPFFSEFWVVFGLRIVSSYFRDSLCTKRGYV